MTAVSTPALILDAAVVDRNVARMAGYAKAHGLKLRPHTKTHKSLRLARKQIEAGAAGLTAAKVGEAEVMAKGCADLLLAFPAVDESRCRRLALLARQALVRVAIDSTAAADALAASAREARSILRILIDLDVGFGRTGVQSPEAALRLADYVRRAEGLRLDGIMIYPGHVWDAPDRQEPALRSIADRLARTLEAWHAHGLNAEVVSGGSTPTAYQSHRIPHLTEIRPGTYIFNDMNTVRGGFCAIEDCAARVLCTVVSDAVPDQVVIDAGTKTLTGDLCLPAPDSGHGHVVEYPEARIGRLSEEHGQIDVGRCRVRPSVGDRLTVIPNHICPCVNLQDAVWWRNEDGGLEPLTVDARGRLS